MTISEIKFTKNIVDFNKLLKLINWKLDFPRSLFIRDHENLPFSSPYDIDLIVGEREFSKLCICLDKIAKKTSLIFISKKFIDSAIIVLFDLDIQKNKRNWIFFEIRTKYLINKKTTIFSEDIDICYKHNELPVPKEEWIIFFYFHQYLRKKKSKHLYLLKKLNLSEKNISITKKLLRLDSNKILDTVNSKQKLKIISEKNYYSKKKNKYSNLINHIKIKIIKKLYFFRVKSNSLFTINGADGAGKSSILSEISRIVKYLPFEVELIHHNKGGVIKNKPSFVTKKSFFRRVLSYIYFWLPNIIKEFWLYVTHYYRYSINMNSFVIKNTFSSKIIILDRYIYDLWAKDLVKRELSGLTISFVYNLFCRIIKFPSKAYFIFDDPKMIFKRKKELTEIQINSFQVLLNNIFKKINVSFQRVIVKKRKPIDIAKQILKDIIKSNPDLLISIIKENPRF